MSSLTNNRRLIDDMSSLTKTVYTLVRDKVRDSFWLNVGLPTIKPSQLGALAMNLVELICHVDDFCQAFEES